ncbi:UNKNOWN [Stylonychia lemnae]|uniref:Uncharacterized protein n=1 Tax=Stylonychia lemnae TaxID=5949 RepID=A0A078B4Q3_STYLE|nr:UNKNOWN [Stylonychia lemnae]|eukprot:CDW88498.1 UNKNOWN [Stylonychia lemnae]
MQFYPIINIQSAAPLFEKLNQKNQNIAGGPSTLSASTDNNTNNNTNGGAVALYNEQLQKIYSVVINYNLAACYQRRGIFKESHEYISRSIESLRQLTIFQYSTTSTQGETTSHRYKQLLYLRYYAQIILQSCAIKSQLQDHDGALNSAYDGLTSCIKVFKRSLDLCESEILEKMNNKQSSSNKSGMGDVPIVNTQNKMEIESINSEYGVVAERRRTQISGQMLKPEIVLHKARSGKSMSSKKSPSSIDQHKYQNNILNANNHNQVFQSNASKSSAGSSKNSTPERNSRSDNKSVTSSQGRIKSKELRKHSLTSSVKFHLSESEDDQTSLERIHTFNLKIDHNKSQLSESKEAKKKSDKKKKTGQIKSLRTLLNLKVLKKETSQSTDNKGSETTSTSQLQTQLQSLSTRDNIKGQHNKEEQKITLKNQKMRQCYVEEQAKLRDSFMIDSYKILKSLIKNIENLMVYITGQRIQQSVFLKERDIIEEGLECNKDGLAYEITKQRMAKLFREFESMSQIEQLRKVERYKYVGRNMLGVRKFDDWINNLEIGNIMHLNPITTQELMQNIGKHHEFQKDPMLKKLVLLSVSLFSIATEMRMMVQFDDKDKDTKFQLQEASEIWHAQSVFFGAYYLPPNCPLVTHISNSYNKHYIVNKKPNQAAQQQQKQNPPLIFGQKKDSYQKNKTLQNFLMNQTTIQQVPPKINLNSTISNRDLSYNTGGGGSSSYENNTSDNQDHQVLNDQQKQRPIVSLASISPMQVIGLRNKKDKFKIQLKRSMNNSHKFQSESSVSPIRQENEEALAIENMKRQRYEKLSKYLQNKEKEQMRQQKANYQPNIDIIDTEQDHIINIGKMISDPQLKQNTQSNIVSQSNSNNNSSMNAQNINNIAINQINSINIFPQSSKQNKQPIELNIQGNQNLTNQQQKLALINNLLHDEMKKLIIPAPKQSNKHNAPMNKTQIQSSVHKQNNLNQLMSFGSQTRDGSNGTKKKIANPQQFNRPSTSKGESNKSKIIKKQQLLMKTQLTPNRAISRMNQPSINENLGLILSASGQSKNLYLPNQLRSQRIADSSQEKNFQPNIFTQTLDQGTNQAKVNNFLNENENQVHKIPLTAANSQGKYDSNFKEAQAQHQSAIQQKLSATAQFRNNNLQQYFEDWTREEATNSPALRLRKPDQQHNRKF